MKYCKNCKQNVNPTKKFSIGWFIINCFWIIGGGVYLLYFILKKKTCPICHGNNFEHSHSDSEINDINENIKTSKDNNYNDMIARMKADRTSGKGKDELLRMQAVATQVSEDKKAERKADWDKIKAKNVEAKRKRDARELPWQIKADAKKLAKEQKKLNKTT